MQYHEYRCKVVAECLMNGRYVHVAEVKSCYNKGLTVRNAVSVMLGTFKRTRR